MCTVANAVVSPSFSKTLEDITNPTKSRVWEIVSFGPKGMNSATKNSIARFPLASTLIQRMFAVARLPTAPEKVLYNHGRLAS